MDLELPGATVFLGDCIERMKQRPAGSVQMCVTSPPYYGLRDYGVDGQIGLEETPEQFIAKLVEVFREVRRLLADDGTCWVNIGDSYSRNPSKGGSGPGGKNGAYSDTYTKASKVRRGRADASTDNGIKHKDLIGIPWMLAFALRADGWYLRQDIVWHKPNPMPESVTDRCTKSHEYLFLLSKSPTYFFDHEAIKEPAKEWTGRAATFDRGGNDVADQVIPGQTHAQHRPRRADPLDLGNQVNPAVSARMGRYPGWRQDTPPLPTRNRRSVWTIATKPYKGAHFAVFPPALVEPCILAGSRPGDVVLDCFNGSGTTGEVSLEHGRLYEGYELKSDYIDLTRARLSATIERLAEAAAQLGLFQSSAA